MHTHIHACMHTYIHLDLLSLSIAICNILRPGFVHGLDLRAYCRVPCLTRDDFLRRTRLETRAHVQRHCSAPPASRLTSHTPHAHTTCTTLTTHAMHSIRTRDLPSGTQRERGGVTKVTGAETWRRWQARGAGERDACPIARDKGAGESA